MKEKQKTIIICIIALILILIITVVIIKNKKPQVTQEISQGSEEIQNLAETHEDGRKINVSSKINEDRDFEGLLLQEIQLSSKNSETQLLANIKNNTSKPTEAMDIDVILLDKNGNEIVKLSGIIDALNPGEETKLNINSSLDYSEAYDLKIVRK